PQVLPRVPFAMPANAVSDLRRPYPRAARLYQLCLEAIAASPDADAVAQCEVLLGLATAQYRAGDVTSSFETCLQIATLARAAGRPDLLGAAALVVQDVDDATLNAMLAELCQEALDGVGAEDSPLRARLLGALAVAVYHLHRAEPAAVLSQVSLAMAERLADPVSLVVALHARQLLSSSPQGVRERLALGTRLLELGTTTRQPSVVARGRQWRMDALFQLGQVAEFE